MPLPHHAIARAECVAADFAALYHDGSSVDDRDYLERIADQLTTAYLRTEILFLEQSSRHIARHLHANPDLLTSTPHERAERRRQRIKEAHELRSRAATLDDAAEAERQRAAAAAATPPWRLIVPTNRPDTTDTWDALILLDLLTSFTTAAGPILRDLVLRRSFELTTTMRDQLHQITEMYVFRASINAGEVRADAEFVQRTYRACAYWQQVMPRLTPADPIHDDHAAIGATAVAALTWCLTRHGVARTELHLSDLTHNPKLAPTAAEPH
jgi:hypothetical protein